ncbi:MAG: ATP-dependent helicase, partial [Acidimicrobiia bacterium]|nr:ATP-dependent helicase [Acidimicrobiia bacterium]
MTFPGPEELGRGLVVAAGAELDAELALAGDWERVRVDESLLAERPDEAAGAGSTAGGSAPEPDIAGRLADTVEQLHRAWASRRRVLLELDLPAEQLAQLRQPVIVERPVYELGAEFALLTERLQFLLWRNNYDARSGKPVWWWARKAAGLGATLGGRADVELRDGTEAWVDGGPRQPLGRLGPPGEPGPEVPVVHAESLELGRLTLQPPPVGATGDGTLLAPDQQAAVEHLRGPVRVVAPAGSGKTRTLNARLLHLTDDRGIEPSLVTAVAYNNRAAEEMRSRLQRPDLQIRTIHSLGWRIVRDRRPDATLLGEREVRGRLQRILPQTRRAGTDVFGPYIEALADVRIALRHPETVEVERNDVPGFAGIFETYRAGLAERDECDFDEQVYEAIRLLLADPELRALWQRRCRHLLVDEFQDLTPAYLLLLRLLASPGLNVFGVGDDDQTIYGYAGADPRFLLEYERLFPGAGEAALEVSYRCPPEVVTAVGHLLANNRRRLPKTVRAASLGDGDSTDGSAVAVDSTSAGAETIPATAGTNLRDPAAAGAFRILRVPDEAMATRAAEIVAAWRAEGVGDSGIVVLGR